MLKIQLSKTEKATNHVSEPQFQVTQNLQTNTHKEN